MPTLANRNGNLADEADSLTGDVGGPNLANLLSQKLGYAVSANEPYYTPGCVFSTQCVFPNAIIPRRAWAVPSQNLLQYIPAPNVGDGSFSTASVGKILRDDKGSFRVDGNSERWGLLSAYYYFDDYRLNNPYPTGQGGANVPGFAALKLTRDSVQTREEWGNEFVKFDPGRREGKRPPLEQGDTEELFELSDLSTDRRLLNTVRNVADGFCYPAMAGDVIK